MAYKKWTVEIEVADTWVADGFDLTDRRAHAIMCGVLSWAWSHEIRCRVLTRPDNSDVATLQGYKTVEQYLRQRKDD